MCRRDANSLVPVLTALKRRCGQITEVEAAELLGVSTTWFRHYFKKCMKTTYRDACLSIKLQRSVALLSTGMSIPEITAALGYSDRSKFEKAFKRAYAITPSQYRRQFKNRRLAENL